ncbi:hypothetical protein PSAC2689_160048 [Paraburkholderia sacchari]
MSCKSPQSQHLLAELNDSNRSATEMVFCNEAGFEPKWRRFLLVLLLVHFRDGFRRTRMNAEIRQLFESCSRTKCIEKGYRFKSDNPFSFWVWIGRYRFRSRPSTSPISTRPSPYAA